MRSRSIASGAQCFFCEAQPARLYLLTLEYPAFRWENGWTPLREHELHHLCQQHADILTGAGDRGRVHQWTRIRWWLGAR